MYENDMNSISPNLLKATVKIFLLIFCFITISYKCLAQDWIEKTDGNLIKCEVLRVDSTSAHIIHNQGDQKIETYISADQIKSIAYDGESIPASFTLDSIHIEKAFGRNLYYFKGVEFQRSELKRILKLNDKAQLELNKINAHKAISIVCCIAGTLVVAGGYMTGSNPYIESEIHSSDLYVTGGVMIALAIPVYFSSIPKWHKAIDYYNAGLNKTSPVGKAEIRFGFTQNGIGVRMVF